MQGIKFYDPEIVGDTPETVEFRGLQNLVNVLREHVGLRAGKLIFAPDGSVRLIIPLYPKIRHCTRVVAPASSRLQRFHEDPLKCTVCAMSKC